jgi:hypothetical protein
MTFRIAGQVVELDRATIVRRLKRVLPEPVKEHYVVVDARRYPPKQVLSEVTGIDRADFTTHHARRILRRLGFTTARTGAEAPENAPPETARGLPHGGRQAAALAPYRGKWVALGAPTEVLVAADTMEEVVRWLVQHEQTASGGVFRVPRHPAETEILGPL